MAHISANFAKKNLNVPISLVTDNGSLEWIKNNTHEKCIVCFAVVRSLVGYACPSARKNCGTIG